MQILKTVKKVPGGLMVVPLLLGVLVNTFFPNFLEIGGFSSALFQKGALPILGMFLFANGAQINIKQAGEPLLKGVVLTAVKFFIGAGMGILINKAFGPMGVFGIAPLTWVASLTNSNGGLYAALAGEYGDSTDVGAISILSINDGPFLTMVALGASGLASIPVIALIAAVVPILIGFVLGNLDEDLRSFLKPATIIAIPFFAFPLGAALNLGQLVAAGLPGILLGIANVVITGFCGYAAMKIIKSKTPEVGAAIGTSAGNSVGTPVAIAAAVPALKEIASVATVQIAAAIIVTAILCPMLVSFIHRLENQSRNSMV